jgi:Ribosomal protein L7/L12 C-terminal domain
LLALLWAPGMIGQGLGWPYGVVCCLLALLAFAVIWARRAHRRGQTVADAVAALVSEEQLRKADRQRARLDSAALPWLKDKRLSPTDQPGVLVTPSPDAPAYFRRGYDVVLESAGDRRIQVIGRVIKLTRLSPKEVKDLIADVPVTLLRMPDWQMADAARSVLESAGAAVSIADPASATAAEPHLGADRIHRATS